MIDNSLSNSDWQPFTSKKPVTFAGRLLRPFHRHGHRSDGVYGHEVAAVVFLNGARLFAVTLTCASDQVLAAVDEAISNATRMLAHGRWTWGEDPPTIEFSESA